MRKQKGSAVKEKEEKATVGVHFPEKTIFQKLKEMAKAEDRSLSKTAYRIIKSALDGKN